MWALPAAITPSLRCWATSSFGDYFKRDAIQFAWELITSDDWYGIPKDRLYVTIFEGDPANGVPRDDEAEQYWIDARRPEERIKEYGLKDKLLADGRDRPLRPLLRDLLRHGHGSRRDAPASISPSARTKPATSKSGI